MATDPKTQVFVSSTSDLSEERRAVKDALPERSVGVYLYEEDVTRDESPRDVLQKELRKSEVYVAILGHRYGSILPGSSEGRSIVEWEFDTAVSQSTTAIFTFTNVADLTEAEPRQATFIERARDFDSRWSNLFSSVSELRDQVVAAYIFYQDQMREKLAQRLLQEKQSGEKDRAGQPRKITRIRMGVVVASVAALLGIAAATVTRVLPQPDALTLLCVVMAVAVCSILLNDH